MSGAGLFNPNPTFAGGVHPNYMKELTCFKPVEDMPVSAVKECWIPFQMHIGAPAKPLVKKGDKVKKGQMIGEPQGFVSAAVHSPISGKIQKLEPRQHPLGHQTLFALIRNDGNDDEVRDLEPLADPWNADPKDVTRQIQMAGIAGMGGATFPTHVKLSLPPGLKCDVLVINGAECEPFLTCDHRLMVERAEELVEATNFLKVFLGAPKAIIGTEDNKMDAVALMEAECRKYDDLSVAVGQTKYPQGAEHSVVKIATGIEVGPGKLPIHYGVVCTNVATVIQVWRAVRLGEPLIDRIMTVTGNCVENPRNLRVRMGVLFKDIIDYMGGFTRPVGKVVSGGPMMGIAQKTLEIPVLKGRGGLLLLSDDAVRMGEFDECIKCAKCVDACYMNLLPDAMSRFTEFMDYSNAEHFNVMDCKECGACSYVCPANRPLVQWFKLAKGHIVKQRRVAQAEAKRKAEEKAREAEPASEDEAKVAAA
jgi:electron transport complex protein RnfC